MNKIEKMYNREDIERLKKKRISISSFDLNRLIYGVYPKRDYTRYLCSAPQCNYIPCHRTDGKFCHIIATAMKRLFNGEDIVE